MRTIVCTSGTSIAFGVPVPRSSKDIPAFRDGIRDRVQQTERRPDANPKFILQTISAETNSLQALEATSDDLVVLLHTDTEDGEECARAVASVLERHAGLKPSLRRIEGLQVTDARVFRSKGVQSLFQALQSLADDAQGSELVLNVTGGFKSVVPYVTLFGLLKRVPVYYLFERSDALLRLPPVPVQYDYERLGRASEALRRLREAGALPPKVFFDAIPGLEFSEREWYSALLDEEEGLVTLSAFGLLVTEAAERGVSQVFIGPSAQRAYDASAGIARQQFTMMLERASEPMWRQSKRHTFHGTDLHVFKPGSTAQRMAAVVQGHKVFVCELFPDHETYERVLVERNARDYEVSAFSSWQRPLSEPEPPATDEQFVDRLEADRTAAWAEVARLTDETERQDAAQTEARAELETALAAAWADVSRMTGDGVSKQAALDALRTELDERLAQQAQLSEELATLREQCEVLRVRSTQSGPEAPRMPPGRSHRLGLRERVRALRDMARDVARDAVRIALEGELPG